MEGQGRDVHSTVLEIRGVKVKIGDVVLVKGVINQPIGIVVSFDDDCGWPWVMVEDGRMVVWPEHSMEVISESR